MDHEPGTNCIERMLRPIALLGQEPLPEVDRENWRKPDGAKMGSRRKTVVPVAGADELAALGSIHSVESPLRVPPKIQESQL